MSVYKDEKTKKWYVSIRYVDWTGKHRQKMKRGFATKSEAKEYEEQFKLSSSASMNMKVEDFLVNYFRDKKSELKENSLRNKKIMIETHVLPYLGKKKVNEVTARDIFEWQNSIHEKGFEPTYERMLNNQVNALFNHAVKFYKLKESPCKGIKKLGKSDRDKKNIVFWTEDEYELFLRQLEKGTMDYLISEILFWTGMRHGEVMALTPQDINFYENKISVNKTYTRVERKDIVTTPKTETSIRTIDIPEFLKEEIKNYLDRNYMYPETSRIFPIVSRTFSKHFENAIKRAGVKKIRVHDLRHSHAAYLIHQGVQPKIIQERFGHKDIQITMNTYGHLYPGEQAKVAEMMNQNRRKDNYPVEVGTGTEKT